MFHEPHSPEAALFAKYRGYVFRRALCWVSDIDDAEDIASTCWLSLLKHMPLLLKMEEPARCAYIMSCARNQTVDFLRRRGRSACVSMDAWDSDFPDPRGGDPLEEVLLWETLKEAIPRLPERERQVLLRKLDGRDDADIAAELHISPVTVRTHWRRAKLRLRAMTEEPQ